MAVQLLLFGMQHRCVINIKFFTKCIKVVKPYSRAETNTAWKNS